MRICFETLNETNVVVTSKKIVLMPNQIRNTLSPGILRLGASQGPHGAAGGPGWRPGNSGRETVVLEGGVHKSRPLLILRPPEAITQGDAGYTS